MHASATIRFACAIHKGNMCTRRTRQGLAGERTHLVRKENELPLFTIDVE
jgi:hypothetical protein